LLELNLLGNLVNRPIADIVFTKPGQFGFCHVGVSAPKVAEFLQIGFFMTTIPILAGFWGPISDVIFKSKPVMGGISAQT
jgi:hypothetical protein